ncbi:MULTISPECIES: MFS transporter [Gammaproteobacteria]|uniref:MFS transporter n=1 Tax=Gammaproteobacteria TaxID=1236 RepID=UPI00112BEBD3
MAAPHAIPVAAPSAPALSRRDYFLILFALSMGGFAIGTSEFASMGLMPDMVRGLSISEQQVGHLISAYALGVVVGAPLLAIIGARLRRRPLLLALMGFYALGNLASAVAPNYHAMLLFRFVAGLPHGAYFGVAALVAASISRPEQRGVAVGRVMLGLTLAMLAGNPLATWLGQLLDWRYAFGLVALIAVLTVVLVARFLPVDPNEAPQQPLRELKAFNRAPVWLAMLLGSIGFAGMFSVFSYLAPTMTQVTGVSERWIPFGMAAFGLGGVIGGQVGGWMFDRFQFRAIAIVLAWSVLVLLAFPLLAHSPWTVFLGALLVGSMVAVGPALQTHLMDVAGEAQTLAAASNHSAFNIANALGPWLGGMAIGAGFGWTSTGYVGAATALAGLAVWWIAARQGAERPVGAAAHDCA